jgi:iron complex transport system substrate-binding protein
MTDIVVLLGATDRLVARTRYDQGEEVAHLPSLGGGLDPNLESLVALRPDLVLVTPTEDLRPIVERLEALGIPLYAGSTVTLEDLVRLTTNLGRLLGPDAAHAAGIFLDSLDHGLAELSRGFSGRARPSVFYLVWSDPPMTVGPGSYLDDLITVSGGRNVFGDARSPWPQVNLEEILHRNPDWVILPGAGPGDPAPLESIRNAPGWRELAAVREGRVAVVEAELFNRPGARVLEAARTLGEHLHP